MDRRMREVAGKCGGQVVEEGGAQAEAWVNAGNALCARAELATGTAALSDLNAAVQAYRAALSLEEDTEVSCSPT